MIGSIDMVANITRQATTNMVLTAVLWGMASQVSGTGLLAPTAGRAARGASLSRNSVDRKVRKITPPARKNVLRMPTNGGNRPPINGPARLPAMIPDDSTPSAQPEDRKSVV